MLIQKNIKNLYRKYEDINSNIINIFLILQNSLIAFFYILIII